MTRSPYINIADKWYNTGKKKEHSHHIFAKEQWGTNAPENLIRLFATIHQWYHSVFGTERVREAIIQLLSINKPALWDEFIQDILKVLEEKDLEYYYKDWVYHPHKVLKDPKPDIIV